MHFFVRKRIDCSETKQGGITLSATGYLQVHAYTSNAQMPLENVAIAVTDSDNNLLALRLTDESGQIAPIALNVPDFSTSQAPGSGVTPFTSVRLVAHLEDFEDIDIDGVQVFADTVSTQDLEMIPLAELPPAWDKAEFFQTTPQNL